MKRQLYWLAENGVIIDGPFTREEAEKIQGAEKMTLQSSQPRGAAKDVTFWSRSGEDVAFWSRSGDGWYFLDR